MKKRAVMGAVAALALGWSAPAWGAPTDVPTTASVEKAQPAEGRAKVGKIELAYRVLGPADGEPVLIILGLGGQMSEHPDTLSLALAERGFRVISFDNRDAGLSTRMDAFGAPDFAAIAKALEEGRTPPVPYTLNDMAADAVGLLDHLKIDKAHIIGGSMGGMIAQLVAADYPQRTLSLTSLVSSSGNPEIPLGPAVALMGSVGSGDTPEARVESKLKLFRELGGSSFPSSDAELRKEIAKDESRASCGVCVSRQSAATMPNSDRRAKLRTIKAPAAIVGGVDDTIFPAAHAQDTAASIPGAQLWLIPGMGHLLPDPFALLVADIVLVNARRAHAPAS